MFARRRSPATPIPIDRAAEASSRRVPDWILRALRHGAPGDRQERSETSRFAD